MVSNKHSDVLDIVRKFIKLQLENRKLRMFTILSIFLNFLLLVTTVSSAKPMFRFLLDTNFFSSSKLKHFSLMYLTDLQANPSRVLSFSIVLLSRYVLVMVLQTPKTHAGKTVLGSIWETCMCSVVIVILLAELSHPLTYALLMVEDPFIVINNSSIALSTSVLVCSFFHSNIWANESSGGEIEALQKAERIQNEKRGTNWFAVNFYLALSGACFANCWISSLFGGCECKRSWEMIVGFVLTVCSCGMALFLHLSSILVFPQSNKMMHGDYVGFEGGLEYCKISTAPLLSEDRP